MSFILELFAYLVTIQFNIMFSIEREIIKQYSFLDAVKVWIWHAKQ